MTIHTQADDAHAFAFTHIIGKPEVRVHALYAAQLRRMKPSKTFCSSAWVEYRNAVGAYGRTSAMYIIGFAARTRGCAARPLHKCSLVIWEVKLTRLRPVQLAPQFIKRALVHRHQVFQYGVCGSCGRWCRDIESAPQLV